LPQREHLSRLGNVWLQNPIYFITCCVAQRRPLLANRQAAEILTGIFSDAPSIHGWHIGRYAIMPDHVHFFARAQPEAKPLADFVRDWKKWTARQLAQLARAEPPVWQPEFFDHVLRSADSYSEKWDYVRNNPVRAGLVAAPEDWPYAGECEALSF
jgi:REP element-mobilizing transposase RayT